MNEERYLVLLKQCEEDWGALMEHCRPIGDRAARWVAHTGCPELIGGDASFGAAIVAEERLGFVLFSTIDNSGWVDGYAFPASDKKAIRLLERVAAAFDEMYCEEGI